MRGSATSVNNNNDKAGNIVLNCRPTSLTILRDALHTLFIFMAENQYGNMAPWINPMKTLKCNTTTVLMPALLT